MNPYGLAWVVAVVSVLLGLFALHRLTRGLHWPRTRTVLAVLLAVLLLVPAPVPGFEDRYAPAFVVFVFEWLFQQAGHPRTAGMILGAAAALALALLLLAGVFRRRKARG